TQGLQVVGHRHEVPGHGPDLPDHDQGPHGDGLPGVEAATYADGDELLMHVQSGYLGKDGVHSALLRRRASEDVAKGDILLRVLPGDRGQQYRVRGDVRVRLTLGL